MLIDYKKEHVVGYSEVDLNMNFGVLQLIDFVQDMTTEYYESFGSDNPTIKKNNNAGWVLSKTRVKYIKAPVWNERIKARCYTVGVKPVRTENETTIKNEEDEVLCVVKQESCTIDLDSRRVRKLSTIDYPSDMESEKALIEEPFMRLNESFTEDDLVYEERVRVCDIDFNRHVNNAVYVRVILNCFSVEFLENFLTKEFEIHYISEALEGEILSVYRKEMSDGFEFLIMAEDREVVRAWIAFEKH